MTPTKKNLIAGTLTFAFFAIIAFAFIYPMADVVVLLSFLAWGLFNVIKGKL